MKRVQRLLDLAVYAEPLGGAVHDVFQRKLRDAGGIQPLHEEALKVRRLLRRLYGSLHAAYGDVFEILDARTLFRKLKVEIVQSGLEGDIAHLCAQHVK